MKNKILKIFIMKYKKFKIIKNIYKMYIFYKYLIRDTTNMKLNFLLLINKKH